MISANGVVGRIPTNTAPASAVRLMRAFSFRRCAAARLTAPREERGQGRAAAKRPASAGRLARARSSRGIGRLARSPRKGRRKRDNSFPPLGGSGARGGQERGTASRRAAARRDPDGAQRSSGRGRRRARRECRARTVRTVSMTDTAKATGRTVRRSMQTTRNIISHTVRTATATRAAARRSPDGAQRSSGEVAAAPSRVSREAAQGQRERPLSCGLSPQSEGRYPAARSAGAGPLSCGPATLQSRAILRGSMPCGGGSAILGERGSDGNGDRSNSNGVNCDRSSAAEVPSRKCRDRILTRSQKCREKCRAKVPRSVAEVRIIEVRIIVVPCGVPEAAAAAWRVPDGAQRSSGRGRRRAAGGVRCGVPFLACRSAAQKCRAKVPRKVPRYVVACVPCTETAAAARRAPEGAQRPSGRGRRRAVEGKPAQRAQRQRESRAILRGSLRRARAAILRPGAREQGRYPAALRLSRAALSCAARCRAAQRCR